MYRDHLELALAAFLDYPDASDAAIEDTLLDLGVAPWLAVRLALFTVPAFAHVARPDIPFDLTFSQWERGWFRKRLRHLPLMDEPVFVHAVARARAASTEDLSSMAMGSMALQRAEEAIRTAAERNEAPPSSAPIGIELARPLPTPQELPRDRDMRDRLAALLRAHGANVDEREPTWLVEGRGFDVRVFPRFGQHGLTGQVDFVFEDDRLAAGRIVESFGLVNPTWVEARSVALDRFCSVCLHVILEGIFGIACQSGHVDWETWGPFRFCSGLIVMWGEPFGRDEILDFPSMEPLFEEVVAKLPPSEIHALRVCACDSDGRRTVDEMLLDGEPWPEGEAIAKTFVWPQATQGFRIWRWFALAIPDGLGGGEMRRVRCSTQAS
ncbi:MAG: DUF6348 family protein [Polyangiales bacterium]|nr:hypothetical protein [Sandaracinaceae bacterium]